MVYACFVLFLSVMVAHTALNKADDFECEQRCTRGTSLNVYLGAASAERSASYHCPSSGVVLTCVVLGSGYHNL